MSRSIELDTKTFLKFWLVVAGLALAALFIWRAKTGLIIVGLALFLAIAIRPLAAKINRGIYKVSRNKRSRPTLSATLAVLLVVTVVGLILGTIGPVVINETSKFLDQAPQMIETALGESGIVQNIGNAIGIPDLPQQIGSTLDGITHSLSGDLGSLVMTSLSTVGSILTGAILVTILTLLFLIQGPAIAEKMWNWMAKRNAPATEVIHRIASKIAFVISKYVGSQVMVCILDGIISGTAVFICSLIFGFDPGLSFPMGLVTAICFMIPMFGAAISCVIVTVVLFISSPAGAIAWAIFYIIYQQVENNVIIPKVQGNALNLPFLIVLIAMTIGMYMFGLLGAIISVPIAAIMKILMQEYPNLRALRG